MVKVGEMYQRVLVSYVHDSLEPGDVGVITGVGKFGDWATMLVPRLGEYITVSFTTVSNPTYWRKING